MSEKGDKAVALFQQGCNCCQAVVGAYAPECGLSPEDAMRVAAAFGGGMRRGEVCGAVTGALMVLGLKNGARTPEEKDRKADTDARTAAFMKTFQERHGSYLCRELIQAAGKKICAQAIAAAASQVEEAADGV